MKISGDWETKQVHLDGRLLEPGRSQQIWNHSPAGFAWGYGGSGPAQLALAILLTRTSETQAVELHQEFKWQMVAALPQGDFESDMDVDGWIAENRRVDLGEDETNEDNAMMPERHDDWLEAAFEERVSGWDNDF